MKIFKKIILLAVILIVLWIIFNSVLIGVSKKGIVFNSVTKQPLQGIQLFRSTTVAMPSIEGTRTKQLKITSAISDENGGFYFPSFIKFKSPFDTLYQDLLSVNYSGGYRDENDNLINVKNNPVYLSDIYGLGFSGGSTFTTKKPYKQLGHTYKPFNKENTINLSPIVSSLSDCKSDGECLEKNQEFAKNCGITPFGQPGSDTRCEFFRPK